MFVRKSTRISSTQLSFTLFNGSKVNRFVLAVLIIIIFNLNNLEIGECTSVRRRIFNLNSKLESLKKESNSNVMKKQLVELNSLENPLIIYNQSKADDSNNQYQRLQAWWNNVNNSSQMPPIQNFLGTSYNKRKKRSSSSSSFMKRRKPSSSSKNRQLSSGAIVMAVLKQLMTNDDKQDKDKDTNPTPSLATTASNINMTISKYISDSMKNIMKRFRSMMKKARECITLFPFSIDRSCLK